MSTHSRSLSGAVFLSYASQDAATALRICDALRAAGIEVWFDQNELVGGDQWDAKIKRQIRECALFVPIVSINTQARSEGYFRREWNLAAQRVLDMAPGRPFLLPVAIDDTSERNALVTEEFLRVQWMRFPGGVAPPAAVERIRALLQMLAQGTADPLPRRAQPPVEKASKRKTRRSVFWIAGAMLAVAGAIFGVIKSGASPPRTKQLAVLPFNTIGDTPGNQAFCDGLSETITSQLTQLEQFQRRVLVVPMAEVRKEAITTPSQARTLFGATLVLTGSVQRAEALVRVTVSLVDTASLRIVRSGTFDHPTTELYRLQDRVAAQAADWLGLDLSAEAKRVLAAGQTNIGAAYELYVQGRGELARRDIGSNLDAAIVHLGQALIADPKYALAHAASGEAFWEKFIQTKDRQWVDQAQKSCRSALEHGGSLASPHITLAILLNGTGQYEAAVAEAETALRLDPASMEATRVLARAFDRLNRTAESEATYLRAIQRSPENVQVLTDAAGFYWRSGRTTEAERYFRRVAELTPDSYALHRSLGGLYVMMGQADRAAESLERSLSLKPTAQAYSNFGTLRFQQRRYADAAALFATANELTPKDFLVLGNLGDALRYLPGREAEANQAYGRAIHLCENLLQINRNHAGYHASMARYLAFTGDVSRAVAEVTRARELSPASLPVIFNAAVVYERAGNRELALEALALAFKGGYSRSDITQDPDLKELRADPRFASMSNEPVTLDK